MDQQLVTNVLTGVSFIVMVTIYVVNSRVSAKVLDARLELFEATMVDFKHEIKELNKVVVQQALHHQRLDNMDERLLSQGKRLDELSNRVNRYRDSNDLPR